MGSLLSDPDVTATVAMDNHLFSDIEVQPNNIASSRKELTFISDLRP